MRFVIANSRAGQESHVKVGIVGPSAKADHDGISMVDLAAIHEFGAPKVNIPERSFIRRTFVQKQKETGKMISALTAKFIQGQSLEKTLSQLGLWASTEVKKTITTGEGLAGEGGGFRGEPLKPATIARKGSDRPLIDTGRLVNAITYKVWIGRFRDSKGKFVSGGTIE